MRDWLKQKRIIQNLTQEDVALQVGIERAYYTMIENGTRTPSVEVAKKIADVLKFSWIIFFNDEGNETTQRLENQAS